MSTLSPSYFGPLTGSDDFQLPVPGLYADLETGAASLALTDEVLELAPESRICILQQWLRALSAHRDSALVEMFRLASRSWRGQTIVQQIDNFRGECSVQGITCPTDFALLLQQY